MKPLPSRGYRASSQPQRPKPQGLFAVRTELHTRDREEQPDGYSGQSPLTLSALSFLESSRSLPRRHSSSYEVGDCLALRITPHSTNVLFAPAAPSDSRHASHPQSPTSSGNEHGSLSVRLSDSTFESLNWVSTMSYYDSCLGVHYNLTCISCSPDYRDRDFAGLETQPSWFWRPEPELRVSAGK